MSQLVLADIRFEMDDLIRRAVRNARPRDPGVHVRWSAIEYAFGVGSTVAIALCRHYDMDPDEQIEGPECERCAEDATGEID